MESGWLLVARIVGPLLCLVAHAIELERLKVHLTCTLFLSTTCFDYLLSRTYFDVVQDSLLLLGLGLCSWEITPVTMDFFPCFMLVANQVANMSYL